MTRATHDHRLLSVIPLALLCLALLLTPDASRAQIPDDPAQPGANAREETPFGLVFSSVFAPQVGNYTHNDRALRSYGFNPVDLPLMMTYGLRGRVVWPSWSFGLSMLYGFGLHDDPDLSVVPTTSTEMSFSALLGRRLGDSGVAIEGTLGFQSLTLTVGSEAQGGALVFLGPVAGVGLLYVLRDSAPFLALGAGYEAHLNLGASHDNVLWEAPFDRPGTHAAIFSFEVGFSRGLEDAR